MNLITVHSQAVPQGIAHVAEITTAHPWHWLAAGWRDLTQAPAVSIGYGTLFVIASYLITLGVAYNGLLYLLLPLLGGFFLVAPACALGLYEISRRLEQGQTPTLWHAFCALRRNSFQVLNLGVALVVVYLFWLMAANLVFATLTSGVTPSFENFLPFLFSVDNLPALIVGTLVGALFAVVVFAATVVSLPMLLDRDDVDLFSAMQTSVAAFRYNWRPLLLWAALILCVILSGLVTLYVGLALGFPLVGYATWHAYRDLVVR